MSRESTAHNSNLLLRADASAEIGTGHVMRCLALAQAWQASGGTVSLIGCVPPALEDRLAAERIPVWELNADVGQGSDAAETARRAEDVDASWVVVDGYHFGHEYQRRIRSEGSRVLFIDDYGHADRYEADLILNQNIDASATLYDNRAEHTDLLLGPEFALLRREFWSWREPRVAPQKEADRVLVTLGGGDPGNLTTKVVRALSKMNGEETHITVLVGGSNPHEERIREAADDSIEVRKNVDDMAVLMAESDVAVSAGGSTCWELSFMGIPAVIIVLAENQRGIAEGLDELGAAINLGWHEAIDEMEIAKEIESLLSDDAERLRMARTAQKLVDGRGAERVVAAMESSLTDVASDFEHTPGH